MEPKTQHLAMPVTEARLQQVMTMLLRLPRLVELRVAVSGIDVKRGVEDEELVVPETIVEIAKGIVPEEPELSVLLKTIELEPLPDVPERHPLTTLIAMTAKVRAQGLFSSGWYVAEGDSLDHYLAQPKGTLSPSLLGIPVHYVNREQLPVGKLLLAASTTRHSIDATYAVSADIGWG